MRKTPIVLLFAGLAILAGPRWSSAQDVISAHVPFSFVVDGRLMPAGDYTVLRDTSFGDHTLVIESRDRRNTAIALFEYTGTATMKSPLTFKFATIGGRHYLSEVTEPGAGYQLALPKGLLPDTRLAKAGADKTRKGND